MKFNCFLLAALSTLPLFGQAAAHANERYKTEEGRSAVAQTLVSPDREKEQRPKELLGAIGLAPGMTVADVGTGAGFMLPYMAEIVGAKGKVYAEDIFPDFLDKARKNAADHKLNVQFIAGNEKSAMLPANMFDRVLILDAFHHFDYPKEMLDGIGRALKPGGQVAIVEYTKERFANQKGGDPNHVRFDRAQLAREVEGYGWKLVSQKDFTPGIQYISLFQKK